MINAGWVSDATLPRGYLDHACLGPPSASTAAAVTSAVAALAAPSPVTSSPVTSSPVTSSPVTSRPAASGPDATETSIGWIQQAAAARAALGRLFSADAADITLVQNTTEGLATVLSALQWRPGDAVVVADREFLAPVTVCRWLAQVAGIEVRTADGPAAADVRRCLDRKARAVVVSAVAEVSGCRADVEALGEVCRTVGAALVVDGAQEAGVLNRDLPASGADAYTATGHKWLRSPFGTGVLWTSPVLRDQLVPRSRGYMALEDPPGGWATYLGLPGRDARDLLSFRADGAALETGGTPAWLGALGLTCAVEDLLAAGPDKIGQRAMTLATRLRDGITERGHSASVMDPAASSPLVSLAVRPDADGLEDVLAKRGVRASVRGALGNRVLRVSCHGWNEPADVDLVLQAADDGVIPLAPATHPRIVT